MQTTDFKRYKCFKKSLRGDEIWGFFLYNPETKHQRSNLFECKGIESSGNENAKIRG
jgi:hypothetical protein